VKERDELQSVLLGFEKHIEDIQTRVKRLTAERDQLSSQYQQVRHHLLPAKVFFCLLSETRMSEASCFTPHKNENYFIFTVSRF